MSLILFEGFEDTAAWSLVNGVGLVAGRNGQAWKATDLHTGYAFRQCKASEEHATFIAGCAIKLGPDNVPNAGGGAALLTFSSDVGATNHVSLLWKYPYDGGLRLDYGASTAVSTPALITTGIWYYIELKATLHDTTGSYTVKLNGTTVMSATNVDTKNAGTKTVFDTLKIGALTSWSGGPLIFDDVYWLNGAGTTSNDFYGDLAVETLYPEATATTAWLGSDGDTTNNHLLVDEAGTPSMTDYVYSATVGASEVYRLTNVTHTSATVHGMTVLAHADKSDSGARGLKLALKEFGGAYRTSADNALTTTPTTYLASWDRKNDGTVWTVADINGTTPTNGLSAGIEVGS